MNEPQKFRQLLIKLFRYYQRDMIPAPPAALDSFRSLAREKNVPSEAIDQLVAFYEVTNGVPCLDGFNFHRCDDIILFEWWDEQELWLGQRDMDTLRWAKGRFCLGDASNISYGPSYEFTTLLELVERGLKDWYPNDQ